MAGADTLDDCRKQLTKLQATCGDVSAALRQISRELLDTGRPPSALSIEIVSRFRSEFDQLQATIGRSSSPASGEADGGPDQSLSKLREDLETQAMIQATLARLDCFDRIQHVEHTEFAPWQQCLADGTKLRDQLLSSPANQARATAEQFLSQAPLNAVVTLITDSGELSDERWALLLDSVSAAYGRELSTAIARGKLMVMSGTRA